MRLKMKKWMVLLCALLAVSMFAGCGKSDEGTDNSALKLDENVKEDIENISKSMIGFIPSFHEEFDNYSSMMEITDFAAAYSEQYAELDLNFLLQAYDAWDVAKADLGAMGDLQDVSVVVEDGSYVATMPINFEHMDADVIMTVSADQVPVSIEYDIDYPQSKAELIKEAALNTVIGLCTVFIVLIFLSFLISLFKYVPQLFDGSKKKENVQPVPVTAPAPAAAVPADEVQEELVDDLELVAVISAAIAASENTSTDGFVVRSIKRAGGRRR